MKKINILMLALVMIACSSSNEVTEEANPTTTTLNDSIEVPATTTTTSDTGEVVEEYNFLREKMSALTGLEISPELWLKRPRRVLAFKIDNNINARPQSGLQEADAIFEILVEGGMTRFLALFLDKSSSFLLLLNKLKLLLIIHFFCIFIFFVGSVMHLKIDEVWLRHKHHLLIFNPSVGR